MAENEDVITVRIGMDLSEHPDITAVVVSPKATLSPGKILYDTSGRVFPGEVSFDATPLVPTLRRAGQVSFDVSFNDDWSLSDEDKIVLFGGDPSWTTRSRPPREEPDPVAPDGSYCDHPEDQREPLPYQGRAADPAEWECGACGVWQQVEATTATVWDDWRAQRDADMKELEDKIAATLAKKTTTAADAMRAFGESLAEAATFTGATVAEAFKKIGAVPKFDARGSLEIGFAAEKIQDSLAGYQNAILSRRSGYVRGPVTNEMSDDDVKAVIYEAELAARQFMRATHTEPYWAMDREALGRLNRLDSMQHAIAYGFQPTGHQLPAQLIGHPIRVETNVPAGTIALVVE